MSGKILRLRIESYMGLNDVEIDWDQHSIMGIIADGGLGKTSLVNFVRSALTGIIPDEAINVFSGKAKGSIDIEKDGKQYTVNISKTKNSEVVKIISPDNTFGGKQVLQKMVGNIEINPFDLKKMDADEQIRWFKKVCKIDTREIDLERKEIYQSRTAVNNRVKVLKGFLEADENAAIDMEAKAARLKDEKPLGDLPERRAEAVRSNEAVLLKQRDFDDLMLKQARIGSEIQDIDEQIRRLQEQKGQKLLQQGQTAADISQAKHWLDENQPVDLEQLNREIDQINEHNQERLRFMNYLEKYHEMTSAQEEAKTLTVKLGEIDANREALIKKQMVRVAGMELREPAPDEDGKPDPRRGVYFEKKPLSVLSNTEAIKFAIRLRGALNGGALPILILDDFESVGSSGRAELMKLCRDEGYSALVAVVDPNQKELKVVIKNDLDFATEDPAQKKIYINSKKQGAAAAPASQAAGA